MTVNESNWNYMGVLNDFFSPRLDLDGKKLQNGKIQQWKRPKIGQNAEKIAKSNTRLAQIPVINPRYMWGFGVFDVPLSGNFLDF